MRHRSESNQIISARHAGHRRSKGAGRSATKAAEKNVKRKAHYDHLEQSVDADAARRFHEPAAVKSKMTKLASVKIIEHYIEHTDDEDGEILEIIARKCMRGGDAGGDQKARYEAERS